MRCVRGGAGGSAGGGTGMLAKGEEHHKVPLATPWHGGVHVANTVDHIFFGQKMHYSFAKEGGSREGLQGEAFFSSSLFMFYVYVCMCNPKDYDRPALSHLYAQYIHVVVWLEVP